MSYSIREEMDVEDEYLDLLKRNERSHAETLEATRNELEEARKSFFVRLFALALYSFAGKSEHISDPGPRTPDLHPEPE